MFSRSDIYFKCPCCGKRLVVERAAAGGMAPCPGCKAGIRIPRRSGLPPKFVRIAAMAALNVVAAGVLAAAGVAWFRHDARKTPPPGRVAAVAAMEREAPSRSAPPLPLPLAVRRPAAASATAMDELAARNAELQQKNLALATQFEGMAQWVIDNYQGKYPLPLDLVGNLRLPPVADDYTLGRQLGDFLKITPSERTAIDDVLVSTRDKMAKTEASLATVTAGDENSVTLYVPPYEQLGTAMREDLFGTLEVTLGGPRFDKLVDVSRQGLDEAYHYFGTAAREMQFLVMPQQGGEAPYLLITDGWQIPDGDSVTRFNGTQTATREIPGEYASFMSLLPPSVAAFPVKRNGG